MIFVVADIGVNWDGDFDLVKEMIKKSKEVGINAIKFQAFNEEIVKNHPQRSRLMNSSVSKANIESINEVAKFVGIEWFCTPMYPEAIEFLDPFVKRYKIREFDGRILLENKISELFEKLLQTGKDIIVSAQRSPKDTKYFDYPKIKWLYCVPKYPCEISDLDFSHIQDFDGYSNHLPHFLGPLTATILGSTILEVHITSDKSKDFLDNIVSFDYNELKKLVNLIRLVEKMKLQPC